MEPEIGKEKPGAPICGSCGLPIVAGSSAYAVQSGYIEENGDFVRTDACSQLFHTDCI